MTERPAILCARRGSTLVALDELAALELERFSSSKPLKVKVTQARSIAQHRLYFALLEKTVENFPADPFSREAPFDADDLHEWVKMEVGYTRKVRDKHGRVREVTRSIAFDEMDQPTFDVFFARVKKLIEERFFPGIDSEAYEAEVRAMLSSDREAA